MRMGVGGLLKEIPTRPQPRAEARRSALRAPAQVAALVLAAGRSSRMGGANKLLTEVDGQPMVRPRRRGGARLAGAARDRGRPATSRTGCARRSATGR